MTEEQFRELLRLEMRALAATIHNNAPHMNHDAREAVCNIAQVIETQYPETLREYCERVLVYIDTNTDLDRVGERLEITRVTGKSYKEREPDRDYRARLEKKIEEVLRG